MWLGLPKEARDPKTQTELGEQLSISDTTLAHWRKDAEVIKARESAIKVFGGNDMYAVTRKIVDQAKEGGFQQQRLYMEWQGEIGGKVAKKEEAQEVNITFITSKK